MQPRNGAVKIPYHCEGDTFQTHVIEEPIEIKKTRFALKGEVGENYLDLIKNKLFINHAAGRQIYLIANNLYCDNSQGKVS